MLSFFVYCSFNPKLRFFPNPSCPNFQQTCSVDIETNILVHVFIRNVFYSGASFTKLAVTFGLQNQNLEKNRADPTFMDRSLGTLAFVELFSVYKTQPLPPPHKVRWIRLSRMFLRWIRPSRIVQSGGRESYKKISKKNALFNEGTQTL